MENESSPPPHRVACHECDALHAEHPLDPDQVARCQRCGAVLYHRRAETRALPLLCAALILYVLANVFPLLMLETQGRSREIYLIHCVTGLRDQGMPMLALFTFLVLMLFPLLRALALAWVLAAVRWRGPGLAPLLRLATWLKPWTMMEIYLLGILISLIKLADLGDLSLGPGFWAFFALVLALARADGYWNPHALWQRIHA